MNKEKKSKRKRKQAKQKVKQATKINHLDCSLSVCIKNNLIGIIKSRDVKFPVDGELFTKGRQLKEKSSDEIDEKYYEQRYYYFSLYDKGIKMDKESWYSVTPEELAIYIADICKNKSVVDAFCGCGGNTIQFSAVCSHVTAIDIDPNKISFTKNNTKVYSCKDNITFITMDFLKYTDTHNADYIFLSPPWGGTDYKNDENFSIKKWIRPNIFDIIKHALSLSKNLIFYLPRSINISELIDILNECSTDKEDSLFIDIRYLHSANKIKAIVVLYGENFNTITIKDLKNYLNNSYENISNVLMTKAINIARITGITDFIAGETKFKQEQEKAQQALAFKQMLNYLMISQLDEDELNIIKQSEKKEPSPIYLNQCLTKENYDKLISNIV